MIFYWEMSSDLGRVRAASEILWISLIGLLKAWIRQYFTICSIV